MTAPANFDGASPVIRPDDAALLLIDHQTGLFQTVADMPLPTLRRNVTVLARMAAKVHMPVVTTASVPQGPNGPMIPEIHEIAPHATYVARRGEVNSWDCQDFLDAVKATGKKQLIIAGTITSVCMAFPALSAVAEGYQVFCVVDASGTYSKQAQEITMARIVQAGIVPIDTPAVVSEVQKTWHRDDAMDWMAIWSEMFPNYQLLVDSHARAQEAERTHEPLDSERD
ncbi:isochorismatase family protein [Kocuria sp.]|uniref:isochorismatase family protein n=1 Tax=Kocuria sp. TaxID=1871328 RepID=UPI0026DB59E3|nr:isochorismatase family protein [Kocuria sp.]MDO4918987.1 isochorismatase family protein [Kocuria sp.]